MAFISAGMRSCSSSPLQCSAVNRITEHMPEDSL
jgi:hypothetical protein